MRHLPLVQQVRTRRLSCTLTAAIPHHRRDSGGGKEGEGDGPLGLRHCNDYWDGDKDENDYLAALRISDSAQISYHVAYALKVQLQPS